jgi:cyclopropane fatty-acyl-phospholipid synthase-like methyltransferase
VEICRDLKLEAQQGDVFEHLAQNESRYDAIVCNEFLEHLKKPVVFEFLDLCHSALRTGGRLIAKVPNMACPVAANRSRYADVTHETGYTDHSLRTVLEVCGFSQVHVLEMDVYVTRNPVANAAGRLLFAVTAACFRGLELLYGIQTPHAMTKSILAAGVREDS